MMVTIRLYRQHDLDLIALYRHPNFSLSAAIKRALIAYVRKEQLSIQQPPTYDLPNEKISRIIQMHIVLNEEYDQDIIKWIKGTKEGYRNSVLKNIVRGYMIGPCVYSYQKDDNAKNEAIENNDLFLSNVKNATNLNKSKYNKSKKKKVKQDNKRVEDSVLAKEILSNDIPQKKDIVFVERIDDDDIKVEIPTKIEHKVEEPILSNTNEEDGDDMWGDIDSMMNAF